MRRVVVFGVLALCAVFPGVFGQQVPKRRLAIAEFDYSAVMTASQAIFGTHVNIGRGIAALIAKRLTDRGTFVVLERSKLDALVREQNLTAGSQGQATGGPSAGRVQGADLLLVGDITTFGFDDKSLGVKGGGGFFGSGIRAVGGAFRRREDKAVVVISYRLVDVATSETLLAGEARGESVRKSKGIGGLFAGAGVITGGAVDMTSSNFRETIIGEATTDAVDKLVDALVAKAASLPAPEVKARVADVAGSTVVITAGAKAGVQVGDRFEVERIEKEIRDPETKEILDVLTRKIGELVITEVKENVSVGTYTGSAEVKVGDAVKKL